MATSLAQIMAAITTALSADLGTTDLSATGAVLRGMYDGPPGGRLPFACVGPAQPKGQQGPTMQEYSRTVEVDVLVWAAGTTADLNARTIAAEVLLDEVMTAFEVARATPGNVLYDLDEFALPDSLLPNAADLLQTEPLFVVLTVAFAWQRVSGVG